MRTTLTILALFGLVGCLTATEPKEPTCTQPVPKGCIRDSACILNCPDIRPPTP